MITKIVFAPVFGKTMDLPFSIEISDEETFRNAISKAIHILAQKQKNPDLLKKSFDVSTNSADIMLLPSEFNKEIKQIQKKFGTSAFCLKLGSLFRVINS